MMKTFFLKKSNRLPHIPSDSPVIIVHTQQLANHIPHLPYDLPVIVVPKPDKNCPSGFKKIWAKKQNIIQWLEFFHQKYPSYSDIEIQHDEMDYLPDSDTKSDIFQCIMIHVLTVEGEQMMEEEGKREIIMRFLSI